MMLRTITERLRLRFAAKAPGKVLLFNQIHLEWFFVMNDSILRLILRTYKMLDGVLRYLSTAIEADTRSVTENA